MTGPLARLAELRDVTSHRASSWDRTGGNHDNIRIPPGGRVDLEPLVGPGVVRHIWMTAACADPLFLRKVVVRAFWDGEPTPSVEVPLGDFFGLGHATTRNFWSLPLQMAPQEGRGFNCWFPMPFAEARFEVENEAADELTLYYYIDYERGEDDPGLGRFHAQWRRANPTRGLDATEGASNEEVLFGGTNVTGEENYVILEAAGRGHYVGCTLAIENRRLVGPETWNWYGEGDDMIFVDGEAFPPSLHGTGTEDYFGTAWCPSEPYESPYLGIVMPGGENWSGRIALYRFHVEDPVRFRRSIRVTIEHGHANRRADDVSSVAYWYQSEPHAAFPALLPVQERLPGPVARTEG